LFWDLSSGKQIRRSVSFINSENEKEESNLHFLFFFFFFILTIHFRGVITKKPKSMATEIFTDAVAFKVDFPKDASVDQKGLLIGLSVLINSIFYEGHDE
jgi:hypothetical protein